MDEIVKHQIRALQSEIEFLQFNLDYVPAPVLAVCVQLRRLRWTLSRLAGLERRADAPAPADAAFASPVPAAGGAPRVFIDATDTSRSAESTGVRRVVRELCVASAQDGLAVPVRIGDNGFVALSEGAAIAFGPNDRLILLDVGWTRTADYAAAIRSFRAAGGTLVLGIHDLIPLMQPGFVPRVFAAAFEGWMKAIVPLCDAVVAVSRSVALEFRAWLPTSGVDHRPDLPIGWFTLGADFAGASASTTAATPAATAILQSGERFFISVGTLEPRKGHAVALDAFETYWRSGGDARYVIVGRRGFASDALIDRITTHPEFGRKLFWLADAVDQDLIGLYGSALALVFPSVAEGFGLPIVEAAHYGTPVIASDIPVLREVGEGQIDYFRLFDSDDLAEKLASASRQPRRSPRIAVLNWRQSATALTNMVAQGKYQLSLDEVRA